jgi:hypothetical protein
MNKQFGYRAQEIRTFFLIFKREGREASEGKAKIFSMFTHDKSFDIILDPSLLEIDQ